MSYTVIFPYVFGSLDTTISDRSSLRLSSAENGDRSVIGDSLTSVITQLFPGFNLNLGDRVGGASGSPTTTVPGSPATIAPTTGTTPAELLRQAEALFAQADAALAKSPPDFATYQTKLSQARGLVQQALTAVKG